MLIYLFAVLIFRVFKLADCLMIWGLEDTNRRMKGKNKY